MGPCSISFLDAVLATVSSVWRNTTPFLLQDVNSISSFVLRTRNGGVRHPRARRYAAPCQRIRSCLWLMVVGTALVASVVARIAMATTRAVCGTGTSFGSSVLQDFHRACLSGHEHLWLRNVQMLPNGIPGGVRLVVERLYSPSHPVSRSVVGLLRFAIPDAVRTRGSLLVAHRLDVGSVAAYEFAMLLFFTARSSAVRDTWARGRLERAIVSPCVSRATTTRPCTIKSWLLSSGCMRIGVIRT